LIQAGGNSKKDWKDAKMFPFFGQIFGIENWVLNLAACFCPFMEENMASEANCYFNNIYALGFIHTRDLDPAISPSDAISIEILPSFQIAITGDNDNILCFVACVNATLQRYNYGATTLSITTISITINKMPHLA
jgi:hypothetical protein